MKGDAKLREVCPLRECFKMIDGFTGFDFDDPLHPPSSFGGIQHQIGEYHRSGRRADRHVLLGSRIDARIELSLQLGLEEPDQPIVFQLLADRPYEDGAHLMGLQAVEFNWIIKLLTLA